MRYTRKHGLMVTAIEWTGTNLVEVQRFMDPASPLVRADKEGTLVMMVDTYSTKYGYSDHELSSVPAGAFIIKDPTHPYVSVLTAEVFAQQFELDNVGPGKL